MAAPYLFEILVPTVSNNKLPFSIEYHQIWDRAVRAISGGLTIMGTVNGEWMSANGELFRDCMIPVRIMCTVEQMTQIADMTLIYYNQKCVMYYRVADMVTMVRKPVGFPKGFADGMAELNTNAFD